jgi:ATP-dependent Zn protease
VPEFEAELTILLAGRAAERLVLCSISAGAGGGESSDLATASALHLRFDREFGLGTNGNAWLGPAAMQRLGPDDATRLRVRLDRFERRARALLEPHRELLERLAAHLVDCRDLGEADLRPWLAGLPVDKTAGKPA